MVDVIIKHGERVVDENGKESWVITLDSKTINKGDDTDKSKLVIESWSGLRQEDVPEESAVYPTVTIKPNGDIVCETQPRTRDWTPSFGKNVPVVLVTTPSTIDDAMVAIVKKKADAALVVTNYKDSLDRGCSNIPIGFKITDMHGDCGVIVGAGGDYDGVTWDPDNLLGSDKFKEQLGQLKQILREAPHTWVCDLDINSMYWQAMQAHDIKRTTRETLFRLKVKHRSRYVVYRTYKRRGSKGIIYPYVPWPILKTYPLEW